MKKSVLYLAFLLFIFVIPQNQSTAQVLDGVYVKQHVKDRRPVPYQYVRESDFMWSKIVWRQINLREKMNLHLYYPEFPIEDRQSLIDLVMWGIEEGHITPYGELDENNEFGKMLTLNEVKEKLGAKTDTMVIDGVAQAIVTEAKTNQIKEYIVKEVWFFDKQRSVMEVRIVGFSPIRLYKKLDETTGIEADNFTKVRVCWVYFPQARKILANHEVFNPSNDSERRTFDDIFFKRFFDSFVVKESNTYNNRRVNQYTAGIETMLEADRIKEGLFNFEQDLWQY